MSELKITPLNTWHRANKARMVPFAGWEMPVQYTGIVAEHAHTRSSASIFDICHMGEFALAGPGATQALGKIVTHNLGTLKPGKCRYGFMLNEKGGVLDDLIIYRMAEDEYMLVVNGACEDSDFAWLNERLPESLALENISTETGKIDLQGPKSLEVLEAVLGGDWKELKYFSHIPTEFNGKPLLVSRTGYTGELGYEFYVPAEHAQDLWEKLVAHPLVEPAGLGARDTLRLEMGYPLYGQDLDTVHTPVEAGYSFMLTSEADFTGKDRLDTVKEKLIPLSIPGRRSARTHDKVALPDGTVVGEVTSGSFCPTLGHAAALAYVRAEDAEHTDFVVKGARVDLPAQRAELPFYQGGTARVKLG